MSDNYSILPPSPHPEDPDYWVVKDSQGVAVCGGGELDAWIGWAVFSKGEIPAGIMERIVMRKQLRDEKDVIEQKLKALR